MRKGLYGIFGEDASHAGKDKPALNWTVLRKQALVLLSAARFGRLSKKQFMFKAALNPDMLLHIPACQKTYVFRWYRRAEAL